MPMNNYILNIPGIKVSTVKGCLKPYSSIENLALLQNLTSPGYY